VSCPGARVMLVSSNKTDLSKKKVRKVKVRGGVEGRDKGKAPTAVSRAGRERERTKALPPRGVLSSASLYRSPRRALYGAVRSRRVARRVLLRSLAREGLVSGGAADQRL
jgi:hypothetical protein